MLTTQPVLNDKESITEVMKAFDKFSLFPSLKCNQPKCEIDNISDLKRVSLALCGMDCIDLPNKTIKILGIYFSFNKKLEHEENL